MDAGAPSVVYKGEEVKRKITTDSPISGAEKIMSTGHDLKIKTFFL